MDFSVGIDGAEFDRFKALLDEETRNLAIEMGQAQIANIRMRVQSGVGLNDAPMPPYSMMYKIARMQSGRRGSPRTLLWSGKMLRAMQIIRVTQTQSNVEVTIGFTDRESERKAEENQQRTPWFGISQRDAAILRNLKNKDL